MKTLKNTIAILAFATALFSCSNDDDNNTPAPVAPEKTVYIAGSENITGKTYATIWKNGVPTKLTDGSKLGRALKVVASGSDIYVLASDGPDYNVYKNGIKLYSLVDCTKAEGLYVLGNDVYVSGNYDNFVKYWKNNTQENLSDGVYPCKGKDITLKNNVPYVVGSEIQAIGIRIAKLWKKGSPFVELSPVDKVATANAIYNDGTNIYISGQQEDFGKIWKDEVSSFTTPNVGSLFSVFVSGSDVYALGTGFETYGIKLYKNKNTTNLPDNFEGNSLFVSDADVYVLGTVVLGADDQPALSKNGTITKYGDIFNNVIMKSMCVVK